MLLHCSAADVSRRCTPAAGPAVTCPAAVTCTARPLPANQRARLAHRPNPVLPSPSGARACCCLLAPPFEFPNPQFATSHQPLATTVTVTVMFVRCSSTHSTLSSTPDPPGLTIHSSLCNTLFE